MPCFFLFGFLVSVQDAEGFFIGGAGVGTVIVGLGEPTVCSRRVTIVIIGGVIIHSCHSRTTLVTIVIIIRAEISRLILILLLLPLLLIRRWLPPRLAGCRLGVIVAIVHRSRECVRCSTHPSQVISIITCDICHCARPNRKGPGTNSTDSDVEASGM